MLGFETDIVTLKLGDISPLKIITPSMRAGVKYKQILTSIKEVGIIELPVVARPAKSHGKYMLLDGHSRIEALKEIGEKETACLISTDDETYTYNKHISRISTIQEHRMIVQAIKRGVSEEKLARALNLNVINIIRKRDLLKGICPEAVELLKDKMVAANVFKVLRRMKSVRQIEAATLMRDANVYSLSYINALLAATPKTQLVNPTRPKNIKGLSDEQISRMEAEMGSLHSQYKIIEDSLGPNVLVLTVSKTYLSTLLNNTRIVKYISQNYPEYLTEFRKITAMTLVGGDVSA